MRSSASPHQTKPRFEKTAQRRRRGRPLCAVQGFAGWTSPGPSRSPAESQRRSVLASATVGVGRRASVGFAMVCRQVFLGVQEWVVVYKAWDLKEYVPILQSKTIISI